MKKAIACALVSIIIAGYLLYPTFSSCNEKQLSCYSTTGRDISKFKQALKEKYEVATVLFTPTILKHISTPERTLFLVIGVEKNYNQDELNAIVEFIKSGGKAIIADDFGFGNTVADALSTNETGIKFSGKLLLSENFNLNKSFPVVNASWNNSFYKLLTNAPSALITKGDVTLIAVSGNDAYLDLNDNKAVDLGERLSVPIMAELKFGKGSAILISDPGLFTNEVWSNSEFDNSKFVLALVDKLLPEGGRIIIDESRHAEERYLQNPYNTISAFITLTTNPVLTIITLIVIFVLSILLIFKVKDKSIWQHRLNLNAYNPRAIDLSKEQERIKNIIIDRIKTRYNISEDYIRTLDQASLYNLIGDEVLTFFMLSKRLYRDDEMIDVLNKMNREEWKK